MIDIVGSQQITPFISPGWQSTAKIQVRETEASPKAANSTQAQQDSYSFSPEALELSRETEQKGEDAPGFAGQQGAAEQLNLEEQQQVQQLQQRDREVKAHEQTHKSMLGPYAAGGPYYEYQTGPDNRRYAVGGSVDVDTSKESTPEKTIQKAQVIKRAALGVKDPSSADKSVASQAAKMEQQARMELAQQQKEMQKGLSAYGAAGLATTVDQASESLHVYA